MKYLITGSSGFVGEYLVERLLAQGHEITGIDMSLPGYAHGSRMQARQCSLMDRAAIEKIVDATRPDRVIHLASASSVAYSWQAPVDCFVNNTNIFLNLVDVIRRHGMKCRVLSVGSSEEYGPVSKDELPLREDRPVNPMNPYAVARVAQEDLSRVFTHGYGMDIICTRSFNHVGPRQSDRFVISSFVKQALDVKRGVKDAITCGQLEIVRDFVDVRDVIEAYLCILEKGTAGEIYNVASGKGRSLKEIMEYICRKTGIPFAPVILKELIRPIDNPVIVGDNRKIQALGFHARFTLEQSLDDMIGWWQSKPAGQS